MPNENKMNKFTTLTVQSFINNNKLSKLDNMQESNREIIIYNSDDGKTKVALMTRDGNVWLNQNQLAELFDTSKQNL
jgi:hypothetical protein